MKLGREKASSPLNKFIDESSYPPDPDDESEDWPRYLVGDLEEETATEIEQEAGPSTSRVDQVKEFFQKERLTSTLSDAQQRRESC